MSFRSQTERAPSIDVGLAPKLAIPIAALLLVPVWLQIVGSAMTELDRHLLDLTNAFQGWAFAYSALLYLLSLGAFVALYVHLRSVDVFTGWPDRQWAPTIAVSALLPAGLVALITAVTTVTDVHYMIVSGTDFPWFMPPPMATVATILWVLGGVITAVGLFHVVLQSELRYRMSPAAAMVAATVVGGSVYAMQGLTVGVMGGGRGYPIWGEYLALIAFVAAIGIAVAGMGRAQREWQRHLAVLPLAVVLVGTVAQFLGVVDNGAFFGDPIEWVMPGAATVLFGVMAFAMVGLAAYTYERTETILAPTLVYAITYLASAVAVLVVHPPLPF